MPTIQVKEAFKFTHQDRTTTDYGVGAHDVSDDVAKHWYVQHFIQSPIQSNTAKSEAEAAAAVQAKEKADSEAAAAAAEKAKSEAEAAAAAAAAAAASKGK